MEYSEYNEYSGVIAGSSPRWSERVGRALLFGAAALSALSVLAIFGFLLWFALPVFRGEMLASLLSWQWHPLRGEFGILPMLAGSLCLSFSAMLLAYPLALGVCCFVHGAGPARAGPRDGPRWMRKELLPARRHYKAAVVYVLRRTGRSKRCKSY